MRHRNFDTVEEFWTWDDVLSLDLSENPVGLFSKFSDHFKSYMGAESADIFPFSRASKALTFFLNQHAVNEKNKVLVSAFQCSQIYEAIKQANCEAVFFDHADQKGSIDWHLVSQYFDDDFIAVIIPHLFGVPTDFTPILESAKKHNIFIVEDCAHTLGGILNQKMAGAIGDAAIFSFSYDKPISLGFGGLLMIKDPEIKMEMSSNFLEMEADKKTLDDFYQWLKQRRWLIDKRGGVSARIISLLKKMRVFKEKQHQIPDFFGPVRSALGCMILADYPHISEKRNAHTKFFKENFPDQFWDPEESKGKVKPSWLRFKLLCENHEQACSIGSALTKKGYRSGILNWPECLPALEDHKDLKAQYPNAYYFTRCAVDIPIHQNLKTRDLEAMRDIIKEHL